MWHMATYKISVSLPFLKCNDLYRIPELILQTLIQRYDKNHFVFDPVQIRETNGLLQAVRCHNL